MMAEGQRRVSPSSWCEMAGYTSPAEGECNSIEDGSKKKRRKF
jgi:hypothetical protein